MSIGAHHAHHDAHGIERRDVVVKTVTEVLHLPNVIVYVDNNGVPYSTGTEAGPSVTEAAAAPADAAAEPTPSANAANEAPVESAPEPPSPTPEAAPAPSPAPAPPAQPAPAPEPAPAPPVAPKPPASPEPPTAPAPVPEPAPEPAPAPSPEPSPAPEEPNIIGEVANPSERSTGMGISWTPFNGEIGNVGCKKQDQADSEFEKMAAQFAMVRLYGSACNQVELALRAAQKTGTKLMLGVFDIKNVENETRDLVKQVQAAGQGWTLVDTISVGNEDVQKGVASVDGVIDGVAKARAILKDAGYSGNVVHVDTQNAILDNQVLCGPKAGDYIAANVHPFFNPDTPPSEAGNFVALQTSLLRACGARQNRKRKEIKVVITETGWPAAGNPNGKAVPGKAQQKTALESIKRLFKGDVYLYSAFSNKWLEDSASTFGAEHFWGILDN